LGDQNIGDDKLLNGRKAYQIGLLEAAAPAIKGGYE
jgi:hypothetical protein